MKNVFLITDPNSDPDDLACMVLLRTLIEEYKINLCGVTACKGSTEIRQMRAKFTREVLNCLGLNQVPVAVGGEYRRCLGLGDDSFYWGQEVRTMLSGIENIQYHSCELMEKILQQQDKVTLLVVAPMSDVADFIVYNPLLFCKKIEKIVIMGGGDTETGCPSERSYNNAVCYEAALNVWSFATKNHIPLVWVPRETVYQVQVKRDFYDEIAKIQHILAQILFASNQKLLEMLWEDIHCGRFSHFDIKRFAKVFLGAEGHDIQAKEDFSSVWHKICHFNLYDPVAALTIDEEFFCRCGYFETCPQNKNVLTAKIKDNKAVTDRLYNGIIGCLKKMQKEEKRV